MGDLTTTERGFRIFCQDFTDRSGNIINVVESSLAFEGPHVRIYVGESTESTCAHLDVAQAEKLRNALGTFVHEARTGMLTEKMEEKPHD